MSLSIAGNAALSGYSPAAAPGPSNHPMREAMRDLRQSLRASDLTGARQAYAAIVRSAPEGAQFPRGSEFASLGRALAAGDMAAAQQAHRSMLLSRLDGTPATPEQRVPPVGSLSVEQPVAPVTLLPPTMDSPLGTGIDLFA